MCDRTLQSLLVGWDLFCLCPPPQWDQISKGALTRLVLGGIGLVYLVVEPHVGHSHPVLGQGSGLVTADRGGTSQCFYSLQVLHQTVLTSHALCRQRQTHLKSTPQTCNQFQ